MIELTSGERVEVVSERGLAFSGGAGAYLLPRDKGGGAVEFDAEEVVRIVPLFPQAAS